MGISLRTGSYVDASGFPLALVNIPQINPESNISLMDKSYMWEENISSSDTSIIKSYVGSLGLFPAVASNDFVITNVSVNTSNDTLPAPLYYRHICRFYHYSFGYNPVKQVYITDQDDNILKGINYLVRAIRRNQYVYEIHVLSDFINGPVVQYKVKYNRCKVDGSSVYPSWSEILNTQPYFVQGNPNLNYGEYLLTGPDTSANWTPIVPAVPTISEIKNSIGVSFENAPTLITNDVTNLVPYTVGVEVVYTIRAITGTTFSVQRDKTPTGVANSQYLTSATSNSWGSLTAFSTGTNITGIPGVLLCVNSDNGLIPNDACYFTASSSYYYLKLTSYESIYLTKPKGVTPDDDWYLKVSNGKFRRRMDALGNVSPSGYGVNWGYEIPEYTTAVWDSTYGQPYKNIIDERVSILDSNTIQLKNTPVYIPPSSVLTDSENPGFPSSGLINIRVNDSYIPQTSFNDWDVSNGTIQVASTLSTTDTILANYRYSDPYYTYEGFWGSGYPFTSIYPFPFIELNLNPSSDVGYGMYASGSIASVYIRPYQNADTGYQVNNTTVYHNTTGISETDALMDDGTVLMLHMDGNFEDSSLSRHVVSSASTTLSPVTVDNMEYATNAAASGAYVTDGDYVYGSNFLLGPTETVDQEQTTTIGGTVSLGNSGSYEMRDAQSFKLSTSLNVSAIGIYFDTTQGSPTGYVTCRIETDSSGIPSGTLADANATVKIKPTENSWNYAIFPIYIPLSGSTTYHIVLDCDSQSDNNFWRLSYIGGNLYADGMNTYKHQATGGWVVAGGGEKDIAFKVYTSTGQPSADSEYTFGTGEIQYSVFAVDDKYLPAVDRVWFSTNTSFPHWWKYDLGSGVTKTARKLTIHPYWSGGHSTVKNFVLEGSNNNASWTTIYTGLHYDVDATEEYTFANSTAYRYYRITLNDTYDGSTNYGGMVRVELMELSSKCLECYTESAIKTQGSYSLKCVANASDSLNKKFTHTIGSPIDLTGMSTFIFDIYSSRTGANVKLSMHDSGGITSEYTHTVLSSNTWEQVLWDISGISDSNKNAIDALYVTVVDATVANTFYLDNMHCTANPAELVTIDYSTTKYGSGSCFFNGTSGFLTVPDSTDWSFGSGDFKIEMSVYWVSLSGKQGLLQQRNGSNNYWEIYKHPTNVLWATWVVGGVTKAQYSTDVLSLSTSRWYNITASRVGTNFYIFLDGVSLPLTTWTPIGTNDLGDIDMVLEIGIGSGGAYFSGNLDELRIVKGSGVSSNFTVRDVAYRHGQTDFRLGDISLGPNCNISDIEVIDARSRGGGLSSLGIKNIEDVKVVQPESQFFWDTGYFDGQAVPADATLVVKVPKTILTSSGGPFEADEVRKKIYRHVALGTYIIIEYI